MLYNDQPKQHMTNLLD